MFKAQQGIIRNWQRQEQTLSLQKVNYVPPPTPLESQSRVLPEVRFKSRLKGGYGPGRAN